MTALYWTIGGSLLLLLLLIIFRGRIPKYDNISKSDLGRYFAYLLQHALSDNGTVHLEVEGFKAAVNITRREHSGRPITFTIKLSSGYVSREDITRVADRMSCLGYECKLKYTRARRALHSLAITLDDVDAFTPSSVIDVVNKMFDVHGFSENITYSVFVYGPLKPGFLPEDGDVIKRSPIFRVGWAVGFFAGKIRQLMRGA